MDMKFLLPFLLACGTALLCLGVWNITGMSPGKLNELHEEFRDLRGLTDLPMALADISWASRLFRLFLLVGINALMIGGAYLVPLDHLSAWLQISIVIGLLMVEWLFISFVVQLKRRKYDLNISLSRRVLALHQESANDR